MKRLHDGEYCIECGAMATDTHHCLPGANRKKCEQDKLTVRMCHQCHMRLHNSDNELMLKYKRLAQEEYEKTHTRYDFMVRYGRNYLEGEYE